MTSVPAPGGTSGKRGDTNIKPGAGQYRQARGGETRCAK